MKKSLLFLAAAAVAGVAVTGCSGNSDEKPTAIQNENTQADASGKNASANGKTGEGIRIAWWGNQKRADATIAAFDAFAEANGADFTYEYNSYDAYWETLATQSVGNNLPGIVQQVTDQYAGYINNGLLLDLKSICGKRSVGLKVTVTIFIFPEEIIKMGFMECLLGPM